MAARLLRLSSFKGLQADRWGLLRSRSAVSFCTKTEDSTKPGRKKKAAEKTAEAPDLRDALLAYKSAVGFPVRTRQPAVLLTNSVGEAESASTSSSFPSGAPSEVESAISSSHSAQLTPDRASPPAEEAGGGEADTAAVPAAATEGAPTPETSDPAADETSSSSDSESDSDSDSEDEKSASAGPASSPELQRSSAEKEEHFPEHTGHQAEVQKGPASSHGAPPVEETLRESSGEKLEPLKPSSPQTPSEEVEKVSAEAAEEDAPAVRAATSDTPSPSPVQVTAEDETQTAAPADSPAEETAVDVSEASVKRLGGAEAVEEPAEPQNPSAKAPESQSEKSSPAGAPEELVDPEAQMKASSPAGAPEELVDPEAEMKASSPPGAPEELVDPGQVLEGAGQLQLEEAAAPEPEEPLDNSTYKNYQHHSYNPYTFADLDLEMAKYRLPQPSSGRPSPRH